MNKEKKAKVEQATDYIINKSTIANQLKALYLQADASLLQLNRADNRIRAVFRQMGATTKENPELKALKEYYTAVKRACFFFYEFIDKMIADATYGSNEGDNRTLSYENWNDDSNTFARLTLLFIDRTYHDAEQQQAIFWFIDGLKSHGQFDENDFKYFLKDE